ncbi:MAG: ISNCY family transposase [Chloroflexota bacterium]|nr:ISNCY family transposase [Chloroflexota bacterium]
MQLPQKRTLVLTRLVAQKIDVAEAALVLGLSERSVRRLRSLFVAEGPEALVHGNTGRRPAHALDPALARRVVAAAKDGYAGLNDTHLSELLAEREGLVVSRRSVQRILRTAGIASPRKRRSPRFRSRRQRRAAAGMLVQLDASRHHWLGAEGPEISLLGGIDDATSQVLAAVFREQEDAAGYLMVLHDVVAAHGIPQAVYSDRHSVFWIKPRADGTLLDEEGRERMPTQVGRAFAELEVEMIFASSPQAKGRIERLWGTLQDRLLGEMRLGGITTIEGANAFLAPYLERHNRRFAIAAADPAPAWRALPAGLAVDDVCCLKYGRYVANDNTVMLEGARVQLPPRVRGTYAGVRVEVRHHLDGSISVHLGGKQLARSAAGAAPRLRTQPHGRAPVGGVPVGPRSGDRAHPWRQWRPGQLKTKLHVPRSELA